MPKVLTCTLLFCLLALASPYGCGSQESPSPQMDVLDGFAAEASFDDIVAHEIQDYELVEGRYCVGQQRLPQFAQYDDQCEAVEGKGTCVSMPNPQSGNGYYCALCGLKGEAMVCYMINPE